MSVRRSQVAGSYPRTHPSSRSSSRRSSQEAASTRNGQVRDHWTRRPIRAARWVPPAAEAQSVPRLELPQLELPQLELPQLELPQLELSRWAPGSTECCWQAMRPLPCSRPGRPQPGGLSGRGGAQTTCGRAVVGVARNAPTGTGRTRNRWTRLPLSLAEARGPVRPAGVGIFPRNPR